MAPTMTAIVLGAGYGTRLETDLLQDDSGRFAHLVGVPKVCGRTLSCGRFVLIEIGFIIATFACGWTSTGGALVGRFLIETKHV
jgi:hypothetical protein